MTCKDMAFIPTNFMLPINPHEDGHLPTSLNPTLPSYTPQGVALFMGKRSVSFSGLDACEDMNGDDDLSDDCSQLGEKKRRLNIEQVKTLEKNFELGNKLEPERKTQLARELGLQPRQIAIWFQNRRARWKTKQLEKDYNQLKRQFEALKYDNDALRDQNKKLQAEIMGMKERKMLSEPINLNKETEGSSSNRSENSSEVNFGISRTISAVDSPLFPHLVKPFMTSNRPSHMTQFLQASSKPDLQSPKLEQPIQDASYCNMFCGSLEDQHGFWPWPEHHNFQ